MNFSSSTELGEFNLIVAFYYVFFIIVISIVFTVYLLKSVMLTTFLSDTGTCIDIRALTLVAFNAARRRMNPAIFQTVLRYFYF